MKDELWTNSLNELKTRCEHSKPINLLQPMPIANWSKTFECFYLTLILISYLRDSIRFSFLSVWFNFRMLSSFAAKFEQFQNMYGIVSPPKRVKSD